MEPPSYRKDDEELVAPVALAADLRPFRPRLELQHLAHLELRDEGLGLAVGGASSGSHEVQVESTAAILSSYQSLFETGDERFQSFQS